MTYLWAIPVFLLLVGIHEWGHFIGARISGIRVLKFAIGFGPRLVRWVRQGTEYSLRLLPLGGFVLVDGEMGAEAANDDPGAFQNASKRARLTYVIAGPLMNFVLGFVLFVVAAATTADVYFSVVNQVNAESAAAVAGIQHGDRILTINGQSAETWHELTNLVGNSGGKPVQILLERGGQALTVTAQPQYSPADQRYLLGITPQPSRLPVTFAVKVGAQRTWEQVTGWGHALGALFHRQASISELSGPVGIVTIIGQTAQAGLGYLLSLTAMISIQLGLFNLLPFPVLDGGHIVYLLYEAVRGKRPDPNRLGMIQLAGAILLLGLFLVITYSEVTRLFS